MVAALQSSQKVLEVGQRYGTVAARGVGTAAIPGEEGEGAWVKLPECCAVGAVVSHRSPRGLRWAPLAGVPEGCEAALRVSVVWQAWYFDLWSVSNPAIRWLSNRQQTKKGLYRQLWPPFRRAWA